MSKSRHSILKTLFVRVGILPASSWSDQGLSPVGFTYSFTRSIPRGWYILWIRYESTDLRGYLRFCSQRGSFYQGLSVRPLMRRIRVLHVARKILPLLELESSDPSLVITRLSIRRITSCQAWHLIYKKLKRGHPRYQSSDHVVRPYEAWRDYNKLLNSRFQHSALASYRDWIRLVEPKLSFASLLPSDDAVGNAAGRFVFQSVGVGTSFTPVDVGTWVIAMLPSQSIAMKAEQELANLIESNPSCHLIYTDYDRVTIAGTRYDPNFKPALNLDLALSDPMYAVGCVFSAELWNCALSNLSRYSSQHSVYGIFLEALYSLEAAEVIHFPKILFHLYDQAEAQEPGSHHVRATPESLCTITEFCAAHFPGRVVDASLVHAGRWGQRLTWALPRSPVLVSILIPTRDAFPFLSSCISSLFNVATGVSYELIIVDNGSVDPNAKALLESLRHHDNVTVLDDPRPFNYSSLINKAAKSANGEILCLLNNDTEAITPNWLAQLVAHAMRPEIGCVGPMLLYTDRTVQHGGVVLGIGGIAGHAHKYLRSDVAGFQSRLHLCQNFSAVTGACLIVRAAIWRDLGGLDEKELAVNYNDVDFCLRAASAGYRNLYVPDVQLYHYESKSRGAPSGGAFHQWQQEREVMLKRWGRLIACDPAYSPHLSLAYEDFSLSMKVPDIEGRTNDYQCEWADHA